MPTTRAPRRASTTATSSGACPVRHLRVHELGVELQSYLQAGFEIDAAADGWVLLCNNRRRIILDSREN